MKAPFFQTDFLVSLPSDPTDAMGSLCEEYQKFHQKVIPNPMVPQSGLQYHDDFIEILAIFKAFSKTHTVNLLLPEIGSDKLHNIGTISKALDTLRKELSQKILQRDTSRFFADSTSAYESLFLRVPTYEFSDSEFSAIQTLIDELRTLITESKLISAEHVRRLLLRLEAMQRELHKKTNDIDRFWGFIAEAGIVARKFGEDIKPIVDRVQSLAAIVFGVIKIKEGISEIPALLPTHSHQHSLGDDISSGSPKIGE